MDSRKEKAESRKDFLALIRPWAPILLTCALLSAYSTRSGSPAPELHLSWRDKIDHFCVYGLLATLVFQALPTRLAGMSRWLTAFAIVSAFGIWDEILQYFNPARSGDPLDWLADSIGALTAVVLCSSFPSVRKLVSWKCFTILSQQKACRDESTTG